MTRFSYRQEIAAGFAAFLCSALLVVVSVGPAANTASTFI
jgi:hypothetical protein